jgi:hypothetical protein
MTIRRLKTYTGSQGYVYQYYFVGQRPAPDVKGEEYLFDVTFDRKNTYAVRIVLPEKTVIEWNQAHGRALSGAEQYAAVKLRLFHAFDDLEDALRDGRCLQINSAFMDAALAGLGVD